MDATVASSRLLAAKTKLLAVINAAKPMVARWVGAKDI
jgi:hypothetical protein